MSNIFLISAGCLGMTIAVIHGFLGATKVVQPVDDIQPSAKRILHAIMFLSAVYWFLGGAALVISAFYLDGGGRYAAALIVGGLYLSGAMANFWATRGRHFGWIMLAAATGLTALGV